MAKPEYLIDGEAGYSVLLFYKTKSLTCLREKISEQAGHFGFCMSKQK
jgi:hypothetical protein